VTKKPEEAMTENENKYKNILNQQGSKHRIDFDFLVRKLS
jgi:hypothetical protein